MTRAAVILRNHGKADLIDADTGDFILTDITAAEAQLRAGRVNEIHKRLYELDDDVGEYK